LFDRGNKTWLWLTEAILEFSAIPGLSINAFGYRLLAISSGPDSNLVQMVQQVGWILINPVGAGPF
jgi:hypothetical protein